MVIGQYESGTATKLRLPDASSGTNRVIGSRFL
jgi:hypothetical protein